MRNGWLYDVQWAVLHISKKFTKGTSLLPDLWTIWSRHPKAVELEKGIPLLTGNLKSISGISFNTTYMLHSMTMQLQSQYECGVKRPFWRMLDTLLFPFPAFRSKFPSPSFCLRLRCQWLSVDVRRRAHHQLLWGSTRSRFHMLVLDEFNHWRARKLFSCFGLVEEWLWRGLYAIECDYWYCHYH